MPFERFDKRAPTTSKEPFVSLQKRGPLSLNRAAFALLGEPSAVELLYDKAAQVIGLRAVSPKEPYAYPVRPQGRAGRDPSNWLIAGDKFANHYGIDTSVTRRFPAEMRSDDILAIDLRRGVEVIGNRAKSSSKS